MLQFMEQKHSGLGFQFPGHKMMRIPIKISVSSIPGLYYVVGWVFGEVFSSVTGYVVNNIFYGSIFVDNEIYYVDPFKVK